MLRQGCLGAVDLLALRWIANYPDPDGFLGNLLHSEEGLLAGICGSPEIDRLIEQGRRETDPGLRHSIYRRIDEILVQENLLIPLFHEQSYRFPQPSVRGLRLGLTLPEVRYEELYVSR